MKPTLQKILKEGFRSTGRVCGDLELFYMGNQRKFYDNKNDSIYDIYTASDEFNDQEFKPTPHEY